MPTLQNNHFLNQNLVQERVMGFGPTNGSLGSYCLTTWLHPRSNWHYSIQSDAVKDDYCPGVAAQRKPMLLDWVFGTLPPRLDTSNPSAKVAQLPPRYTLKIPLSGPGGFR